MKRLLCAVFAAILLAVFSDCAAAKEKNIATVVYEVTPQMHCQNCENKIKSNIRFEKGVKSVTTDLKKQTVTINYDPTKTDSKKLGAALGKIGYKATVK